MRVAAADQRSGRERSGRAVSGRRAPRYVSRAGRSARQAGVLPSAGRRSREDRGGRLRRGLEQAYLRASDGAVAAGGGGGAGPRMAVPVRDGRQTPPIQTQLLVGFTQPTRMVPLVRTRSTSAMRGRRFWPSFRNRPGAFLISAAGPAGWARPSRGGSKLRSSASRSMRRPLLSRDSGSTASSWVTSRSCARFRARRVRRDRLRRSKQGIGP